MSGAIDTLAKVDLCCHFDGALPLPTLLRLAKARQRPEGGDLATLKRTLHATTLDKLQAGRAWVRTAFASEQELEDAATDLGRTLIDQTVIHVELHVDPLGFEHVDAGPLEVLCAIDRGLQACLTEREDVFLSWVLIADIRRDLDPTAADALVDAITLELEMPPKLGGLAVGFEGEKEAGLAALAATFERAKAAGLSRVVTAGEVTQGHNPVGKMRVKEAMSLGVQRVVGATAALLDPDATLKLRAHRLPVVVLPSAQVLWGATRSVATHPMRKMKEAGFFTTVGSGWPTLLHTSLAGEFEHLATHHHWRLDDVRNATTRAIEAAFMVPGLRFGLARTVETWRHRPLPTAAAKGDSWSL
ncbi:MAG: hypothetical protein EXR79_15460 [Myxococcales bacterium]|nr:hypothetical protein [Myxococcales bacterium]